MAFRTIDGRTAIVTGATSGIGLETARALSRAGANVVVAGRRKERLDEFVAEAKKERREALAVATDVSDPTAVGALITRAQKKFGSVDILVNNAGSGITAKFEEQTIDDFRQLMEVNFWGAVYACRAAVPLMRAQPSGGIIINVSSILGKRGVPFETAYCSTKFALAGFSEALRVELMRANIDVTTVFPGAVETEFVDASNDQVGLDAFAAMPKLPAAVIAQAIVQNVRVPLPEIIMAADAQLIQAMNTLAPWAMDVALGFSAPFLAQSRRP
jgi:NAD(P)-dependent dehydrogenase (short-subunit alcohol dehydrogenase family)